MPTSSTKQLIFADPTYSLDDAIQDSVATEAEFGYTDVGPVDTLDPEMHEAQYRLFYGSSPLSSLSPSLQSSRSASPTIDFDALNNTHLNMHPRVRLHPTHSNLNSLESLPRDTANRGNLRAKR